MLKVFGLLALYALVCKGILFLIVGPQGGYPVGWDGRVIVSTLLGRELGGAVTLFLVGALGAGIVALVRRKTPAPLPGLKTGTVLTVGLAGLVLAGELGKQSMGLR